MTKLHNVVLADLRRRPAMASAAPTLGLSGAAADAIAVVSDVQTFASNVKDKLMGAWKWVKRKWDEVTHWFIDKINGAWKFIVHIAGEVWQFVLDSAAAVAKATVWLLEKVKAGINVSFVISGAQVN
ncbi:hypothetical protein FRB95_012209 [Tulasnella sp. JGI-2019a]|nr:hypothetical protein FRB95_012209 [Tulasnella sp. JGI-2019a]